MVARIKSEHKEGNVATLQSPRFRLDKDGKRCVSFWYVHDGDLLIDTLTVRTKAGIFEGPKLWSESGNLIIIYSINNV